MRLLLNGSANGAVGSASAAVDAGAGVYNVAIVALGNSANGAASLTSAAADASISDYICH